MIVMKFGGTSNEDAAAMRNVVRIIKAHLGEQPVAVISAIARATNELEQTALLAAQGSEAEATALVTRLFERHNGIADNLLKSRSIAHELESVFYNHLAEIKSLVKGIAILRELTPRAKDAICSYGERLSSRIIAAALIEQGVDAVWVDAKEFMITDDNFGRAQPLTDTVTERLDLCVRPLLAHGKTPVTQGFIGFTPTRSGFGTTGAYTTMGRESSDYSASVIGAAMNATRVQIWTDVDGILTADPRVVPSTRKLNRMTFEEAFELSFFGAKVLHPGTMLPVLDKKIPVEILNSKREQSTGTRVDVPRNGDHLLSPVKSIAHRKNLVIVSMTPHKRLGQYLFWESIFSVLTEAGIVVGTGATSEYSLAFTVDRSADIDGILPRLEQFGRVTINEGKASLCLVGTGVRGAAGFTGRVFNALGDVSVHMISYGASAMNLTLILDEEKVVEALNRLHREFFESLGTHELFEAIQH
jgi:aspartate kinase